MKKKIVATGKSVDRVCPTCFKRGHVVISETPDGWEIWYCSSCGKEKRYKVQ